MHKKSVISSVDLPHGAINAYVKINIFFFIFFVIMSMDLPRGAVNAYVCMYIRVCVSVCVCIHIHKYV